LGLAVPDRFEDWRDEKTKRLETRLREVDALAAAGELLEASLTEEGLSISPIRKSENEAADTIIRRLYTMLPRLRITELLAEVQLSCGSRKRREAGESRRKRETRGCLRPKRRPIAVVRVAPVVRPNFDTLYSSAFLDLTKEPVIVSVPDTNGRYYLLPMLDMWTDVFASPGWRTTGTKAQNFLVAPQKWNGATPPGVTRIDAPTPIVWIIGRTKTDGPADYPAVNAIQAAMKITPLSQWGKPATPVEATIDPGIDMKTPPKVVVDTMEAKKYFTYAAELLKTIPPHVADQPIIHASRRLS